MRRLFQQMVQVLVCGLTTAAFLGQAAAAPPLQDLAKAADLEFGAAVDVNALRADPAYAALIAAQCNAVTPENALKFWPLHPKQDRYFWDDADTFMAFAAEHHLTVRGHTLVWYLALPPWVAERATDRKAAEAILADHIRTVVGRYCGGIAYWDVVNEAFLEDGSMRPMVWLEKLGPDYLATAFRLVHAADPKARLFYNDYGAEEINPKSDAIYAWAKQSLADGVPLQGIGFQMHVDLSVRNWKAIATNLQRFEDLGLEVAITEADVAVPDQLGAFALDRQAEVYGNILKLALGATRGRRLTLWGITDAYSWIPQSNHGKGRALPFDKNLQPKPAVAILERILMESSKSQPATEKD